MISNYDCTRLYYITASEKSRLTRPESGQILFDGCVMKWVHVGKVHGVTRCLAIWDMPWSKPCRRVRTGIAVTVTGREKFSLSRMVYVTMQYLLQYANCIDVYVFTNAEYASRKYTKFVQNILVHALHVGSYRYNCSKFVNVLFHTKFSMDVLNFSREHCVSPLGLHGTNGSPQKRSCNGSDCLITVMPCPSSPPLGTMPPRRA